eukprot:748649-Hanusia_phi.AAC.2
MHSRIPNQRHPQSKCEGRVMNVMLGKACAAEDWILQRAEKVGRHRQNTEGIPEQIEQPMKRRACARASHYNPEP